ncbi:hypothetical protein LCGC14_1305090 [marine sediment metagenome]|uniref:Uncharacterized protein n=1 Tax=marine sediment metagenome TaxID=412755 RepID=A0A0F9L8U2_9ZZZZ
MIILHVHLATSYIILCDKCGCKVPACEKDGNLVCSGCGAIENAKLVINRHLTTLGIE